MPTLCHFPHAYPHFDPLAPMLFDDPTTGNVYASLAHAYICLLHKGRIALQTYLLHRAHKAPFFYDTQMGLVHALKQIKDPMKFTGQEIVSAKERAIAFDAAYALWDAFGARAYPQLWAVRRLDGPFAFQRYVPDWMQNRLNAKLAGHATSTPRDIWDEKRIIALRAMCRRFTPRTTSLTTPALPP